MDNVGRTGQTSSEYSGERTVISMERQCSLSQCIVCNRPCATGISILGMHICSQCEAVLVASKAESPGYDMYVKSLRAIWRGVFPFEYRSEKLSDHSSPQSLEATVCSDPAIG